MGEGITIAGLDSIASGIASVSSWFWGIFTDFVDMIASNDLLLWMVILAIVAGTVGLALKVVRKFGIKGRR